MPVVLVSTYELGHQPLHVAAPAAALREAGHDVRCVDTSVEPWDPDEVAASADAVAFSVPMHTAMRLAVPKARELKARRPDLPIALYGLYAPVSRDVTVGTVADAVFAGTYTPQLLAWVGGADDLRMISLDRPEPALPARDLLPALDRYARLRIDGEERLAGYVEATTGCLHVCRHCPVPTVYDGRFRAVTRDAVLADVAQLVDAGARHITFGDPDFLNGPTHSVRLVEELAATWPELTFDVTTKVDHIVRDPELWPRLARAGCLFVVSAFETTNDAILETLAKGHTTAQAVDAIRLLRRHDIEVRPSWMPFTPWTTLGDLDSILRFVIEHDLVGNVDPVHYTIRMLVPEGSLLLGLDDLAPYLDGYDAELLTHRWRARDPRTDELQHALARLVETGTDRDASLIETFVEIRDAVRAAAGGTAEDLADLDALSVTDTGASPRLTEPWYCCAEPTTAMAGVPSAAR